MATDTSTALDTLRDAQTLLKEVDLRVLPRDSRQPVKDAREGVKAALKAAKG